MPRKKEEVCGKPTQYNLQTLEYDWKELPDTHYQIPQRQQRKRPQATVGSPSKEVKLLPVPPPPCPPMTALSPMPAPSYPIQEAVSGGGGSAVGGPSDIYGREVVDGSVGRDPQYSQHGGHPDWRSGGAMPCGREVPQPLVSEQRAEMHPPVYVAPWSHDDIRRMVHANYAEAQRKYLTGRL